MNKTTILTADEIYERTLKLVAPLPSQETYSRQLASIFSMHLRRNALMDTGISADELPSASAIIVAPTGQGKTYIVRKMCEAVGLNLIIIDCSTLTPEGYKGVNLSQSLAGAANTAKSKHAFERSILFLDEIDKLVRESQSPNGFSAMPNILQLFNNGSVATDGKGGGIDISRFTVLFGGAFVGLEKIIRDRVAPKPAMGFGCGGTANSQPKLTDAQIMTRANQADIEKYGVMPELLGRIGTVLSISPLLEEDYRCLLNADTGSVRTKYQTYLRGSYGVDFAISDAAVSSIASECMKSKTGARAVNPIIHALMQEAIVGIERDDSISKVTLDADGEARCIRYEHKEVGESATTKTHDSDETPVLPWHTICANNEPALVRTFCRYYRNAGGPPECEEELRNFLDCLMPFMHTIQDDEWTMVSLKKLAKATFRDGEKSPFDIMMEDYRITLLNAYKEFNENYSRWTARNLVEALNFIQGYLEEKHGPCQIRFSIKHRILVTPQFRRCR